MASARRTRQRFSAGRLTTGLFVSLLALASAPAALAQADLSEQLVLPLPPVGGPVLAPEAPEPAEHVFTLRHIYHHGAHLYPQLHRRKDVHERDSTVFLAAEDGYDRHQLPVLKAKSRPAPIERLVDRRPSVVNPLVAMAREQGFATILSPSAWTVDNVAVPDMKDKETIVNMAYMAANAYVEHPGETDWYDVGEPFNRSADFGWEGDGLRGHVFADATNSTIVIGLKGTSLAIFDGEGTTTNDKENDNLFFSCCCAQQGQWTYRQVCDCATGTYACNNTCVRSALREENRYYMAARELYANVTREYPDANVWLTGHSLGGAVSSFVGQTYGHPAVTFQAVPDALASGRLGLPVPPGADPQRPQTWQNTGTYHVGHTADPIYIGTCNGASATCSYAGYALESSCHTGYECVYDVVADMGWRVGVGTHKIRTVISDILLKYDGPPNCTFTPECLDCARWKMYESNGTDGSTTSVPSTSTKTRTRTATCQTPGWWGCLDETTSEEVTATTSPTSVPSPTSETTTTSETSTTCKTPGRFWGCLDESTTTTSTSTSTSTSTKTTSTTETTSTATCHTPGRFWGCLDETATATATKAPTHAITAAPTGTAAPTPPKTPKKQHCLHRNWFGICKDWEDDNEL